MQWKYIYLTVFWDVQTGEKVDFNELWKCYNNGEVMSTCYQ